MGGKAVHNESVSAVEVIPPVKGIWPVPHLPTSYSGRISMGHTALIRLNFLVEFYICQEDVGIAQTHKVQTLMPCWQRRKLFLGRGPGNSKSLTRISFRQNVSESLQGPPGP